MENTMIKELISVLMDDYKDTEMLVDYAEEAMEEGNKELSSFFSNRAKHRMADAREAERWVDSIGSADYIHEAYKDYHEEQCSRLKKKLDRLM
jgi:hypothetical protein